MWQCLSVCTSINKLFLHMTAALYMRYIHCSGVYAMFFWISSSSKKDRLRLKKKYCNRSSICDNVCLSVCISLTSCTCNIKLFLHISTAMSIYDLESMFGCLCNFQLSMQCSGDDAMLGCKCNVGMLIHCTDLDAMLGCWCNIWVFMQFWGVISMFGCWCNIGCWCIVQETR